MATLSYFASDGTIKQSFPGAVSYEGTSTIKVWGSNSQLATITPGPGESVGYEWNSPTITTTSYLVDAGDRNQTLTCSNASPVAFALPQAINGSGGDFSTGFTFELINLGAGDCTITPTGCLINGAATIVLSQGEGFTIESINGNWMATQGATGPPGPPGANGANGLGFLYQSIKQNSTVGNVTTLQTLVSFDAFSAGLLNVIGRRLVIKGKGFFTTALAEIPTIRLDVYMAAASRASITSAAVTASLTNSPFEYEFVFQTSVIGASGRLITTASMLMSLNGTIYTNYMSIPDTDTGAFDLTGTFGPAVTVTCGGTSLTQIVVRSSIAQVS